MAEQLQYQRKLNEWKASKKAEGGGDTGGKPKAGGGEDGGFKELTPAELGKLSLAEQL